MKIPSLNLLSDETDSIEVNNEWAIVLGLKESLVFTLIESGLSTRSQIHQRLEFASVHSVGRWLRSLEDGGFIESHTAGNLDKTKYYEVSNYPDLEEHKAKSDRLNDGYVYFVEREDDGLIKIGMTHNLKSRFNSLEREFGKLKLRLAFRSNNIKWLESSFHDMYSSNNVKHEWFKLNDSDLMNANRQFRWWCKNEQF
mgnify:FL=1